MEQKLQDIQRVMERVRKLLAIAEDTRANPNEAAAAAHQAKVIMTKYQLEHADVMRVQFEDGTADFGEAESSVVGMREGKGITRQPAKWAGWIAIAVARFNDCEVRYKRLPNGGVHMQFYGFRADAQVAAWMYDYLTGCLFRDVRDWSASDRPSKADVNAYRIGYVMALTANINALRKQEVAANTTQSGQLMVIAKRDAIAKHFGEAKYGNRTATVTTGSSAARAAGAAAGSRVDVQRRAVGTSGGAAPLRLGR